MSFWIVTHRFHRTRIGPFLMNSGQLSHELGVLPYVGFAAAESREVWWVNR